MESAPDLSGKVIGPYGFFLIAESDVDAASGVHDIEVDMDLAPVKAATWSAPSASN